MAIVIVADCQVWPLKSIWAASRTTQCREDMVCAIVKHVVTMRHAWAVAWCHKTRWWDQAALSSKVQHTSFGVYQSLMRSSEDVILWFAWESSPECCRPRYCCCCCCWSVFRMFSWSLAWYGQANLLLWVKSNHKDQLWPKLFFKQSQVRVTRCISINRTAGQPESDQYLQSFDECVAVYIWNVQ